MRTTAAVLVLALLAIVGAGCVGGPETSPAADSTPTADDPTPSADDQTAVDTPVADPTPSADEPTAVDTEVAGVECRNDLRVNFWGRDDPDQWDRDLVRVGYPVPSNSSFHVVAYVDGTPEGVISETGSQEGVVVMNDGARIELDREFSGEHTVRVAIHRDDGDGMFDRDVDPPCLNDGERIQTGPERIDFSRFG